MWFVAGGTRYKIYISKIINNFNLTQYRCSSHSKQLSPPTKAKGHISGFAVVPWHTPLWQTCVYLWPCAAWPVSNIYTNMKIVFKLDVKTWRNLGISFTINTSGKTLSICPSLCSFQPSDALKLLTIESDHPCCIRKTTACGSSTSGKSVRVEDQATILSGSSSTVPSVRVLEKINKKFPQEMSDNAGPSCLNMGRVVMGRVVFGPTCPVSESPAVGI